MIAQLQSNSSPFEASATAVRTAPSSKIVPAVNQDLVQELAAMREEMTVLRKELKEITTIQSPLVGIEQVACYFGKSQDTIRRWIKDRVISCYKIPNNKGHALLFSFKQLESDLEDYLQERF